MDAEDCAIKARFWANAKLALDEIASPGHTFESADLKPKTAVATNHVDSEIGDRRPATFPGSGAEPATIER
jgi:hypothetical protein